MKNGIMRLLYPLLILLLIPSVFGIEERIGVRIIDGDTIDTESERIRLADINTPERGEQGYDEARSFLANLLLNRSIYVDLDEEDRYGRAVGVVYLTYNQTHLSNINYLLVLEGYAEMKDYKNRFDPTTWELYVSKEIIPEFPLFMPLAVSIAITLLIYGIRHKVLNL